MPTKRKDLRLILARELAQQVASPVFIVDDHANLVFYNEHAEHILGLSFADAGELSAGEWGTKWMPEDPELGPLAVEDLPLTIAVAQQRPAHRPLIITTPDGAKRRIEVTAFPLLSKDEFVGAIAIFWEAN